MTPFKIGDRVQWTSQSQAWRKKKEGVVIAVVPAGHLAEKRLPVGFTQNSTTGYGMARKHESYLVKVGNSKRAYWPRVKHLSPF